MNTRKGEEKKQHRRGKKWKRGGEIAARAQGGIDTYLSQVFK